MSSQQLSPVLVWSTEVSDLWFASVLIRPYYVTNMKCELPTIVTVWAHPWMLLLMLSGLSFSGYLPWFPTHQFQTLCSFYRHIEIVGLVSSYLQHPSCLQAECVLWTQHTPPCLLPPTGHLLFWYTEVEKTPLLRVLLVVMAVWSLQRQLG